MSLPLVVITDSPVENDLSIETSVLAGMRVEKATWKNEAELSVAVREADAILCMHAPLQQEVIRALTRCKIIARFGTGLDNIDRAAAQAAGIDVVGVNDYCTEEVANHVLALLLSWNRKILGYDVFVREKRWNQRAQTTGNWGCGPLSRLSGKVLGLVGFGRIGQAVAQRAQAFGLRIVAYSRQSNPAAGRPGNVEFTGSRELLSQCDFVSLHLPLTRDTHHWLDAEKIAWMKPGAVVINTSRGGLIDEAVLVKALRSGHLAGALLDVYEKAPLPLAHPLRELPNTILTPHVAFYAEESLAQLRRSAATACRTKLIPLLAAAV